MTKSEKAAVFVIVLILCATPALVRFRFAHPCMTETQLMMHTLDALMGRTIEGVCK